MKRNNISIKYIGAVKAYATHMLVAVLLLAGIAPAMNHRSVSAAQLTGRKATISNSKAGATGVSITFDYTLPTTGSALQGIVYNFCTTPLGSCTVPTGMVVNAATHTSQTGFPNNGTAFATRTGADLGACLSTSGTNYTRCFLRTQATTGGGAVQHVIGGITAPTAKQSVYIRIALYSDTSYATLVDSGIVAVAFVDQLTVTGRVQERLDFCVASIATGASLPADVAACVALASTTIDIGVVDNTSTYAVSPVATTATNGANDKYGILMSNTNASGGLAISYYPEAATTGTNQLRDFRVSGATCNASNANLTDQCFQNAGSSGTTYSGSGIERFGIQIPCIDTTQGTTAVLGSVPAAYSNTDNNTASTANCHQLATDAGVKFAWETGGSATTLASSTSVVDDEIVKIRYGAAAASTTPTGAYSVVTTYIATPTF